MPLTSGAKLGPYEIVAPLGAGGMGEVYRARDARLGREVAIKVLPQHLSTSPEVRARFEREAKTVSSLNHPNICVLFDVGREGDVDYLVMELVDGETLAARLARGALPTAEVVRLGAQIADALERAHRAGVIHRDLKPSNVMLTKSGTKLMDFGLARATGLAGPASGSGATIAALTQSPTVAQPLTAEGTIVGTFQYMSPEQLEGKEADGRTDIWALGCVIYEMSTGRRAFEGKSQASLISSIMKDEPAPISQVSPMSPLALDRLVRTCLAKDPDDRWQSAADLRRELTWITGGGSQAGAPVAAGARRARPPHAAIGWIGGGAVALAGLLVAFGPWSARHDDERLVRFTVASPPGAYLGIPAEAEFSPDGRVVAFVATDTTGVNHIYLRPLSNPEARVVTGTQRGNLPFWSPDGRMLGFFSDGKLRKVALDGSDPVVLCEAPDARGGTWSKAGVILFAPNNQGPIARVSANGGQPSPLTHVDPARGERGHRYPQFLPDGKHFLYVAVGAAEEQSTFAASLDKAAPVEVCRAGSMARYAAPGYLLYLDTGVNSPHRRLLARRFDPASLHATGDPELVLDDINANNFGYTNVAISNDGCLIAEHWTAPPLHMEWWDRRGNRVSKVPEDIIAQGGALSPDAQRLAYGAATSDLFVRDLSSGVSTRLTFDNKLVSNVAWSFDGRRIAFARLFTSGGWVAYVKSADGTGPDSLLFHARGLFTYPMCWSRDGRWLVANCSDSLGNFDLWRIPMAGQGRPEVYQRTPEQEQDAKLSPDGHWIAYIATQGDQSALYVQSFPEPGAKYQIAAQDPAACLWSDRGDQILYGDRKRQLFAVQVSTAGGFRQGATTKLFQMSGNWIILDVARGEQRVLVGDFGDVSASTRFDVVLAWTRLLEKR